jgi:hypothetical protein
MRPDKPHGVANLLRGRQLRWQRHKRKLQYQIMCRVHKVSGCGSPSGCCVYREQQVTLKRDLGVWRAATGVPR